MDDFTVAQDSQGELISGLIVLCKNSSHSITLIRALLDELLERSNRHAERSAQQAATIAQLEVRISRLEEMTEHMEYPVLREEQNGQQL